MVEEQEQLLKAVLAEVKEEAIQHKTMMLTTVQVQEEAVEQDIMVAVEEVQVQ